MLCIRSKRPVKNVGLEVALPDGNISAVTVRDAGADYSRLVDAKIALRGNEAPLFNHHGQMTGVQILFKRSGHCAD